MTRPQATHKNRAIPTWDIFCRVVDNFGDIGVCWRLACQLTHEHQLPVRLWVDQLESLAAIYPHCAPQERQHLNGVEVRIWRDHFNVDRIADIVIEAFACHLPEDYIAHMKRANRPIQWLNLEYLSAESWVADCHLLVSMHPQTGLKKTYFFPGFSESTGGLLREINLIANRNQFVHSQQQLAFQTTLGLMVRPKNTLLISFFSYENSAIKSLLQLWQLSDGPIICFIPVGKTLNAVNKIFNLALVANDRYKTGNLEILAIPFLSQTEYDQLLWTCDINFVRGEDSFVRAQWAAKPFIWQIYPQDDFVHMDKLRAFTDQYTAAATLELNRAIRSLFDLWNQGDDCQQAWREVMQYHQQWIEHSQNWCNSLRSRPDLASNLVQYCQKAL